MALMCQGRVEYESIELAYLVRMADAFPAEFERLRALQEMGLVQVDDEAIQVTATGWFFVRAIAMVFDRHLQADQTRERFSRII
jgi:oxygen-independent coproporphyrinogen-3 oxidase